MSLRMMYENGPNVYSLEQHASYALGHVFTNHPHDLSLSFSLRFHFERRVPLYHNEVGVFCTGVFEQANLVQNEQV